MSRPTQHEDLSFVIRDVRGALKEASHGLVDREILVDLIALGAVAGEHLLIIGPPGTGKSEAVRRVARALGGRYFEYLLGRFTEPMEIFGPVDLAKLKEGVVETDPTGMLPEADIAFLDEVFQGSNAILNTLLGLLNERRFRRGHTDLPCPLRIAVGASNELPEDSSLAAFADRFLLRTFVEPIPDSRLEELLAGGWELGRSMAETTASLDHLDRLGAMCREADLTEVRPRLAEGLRKLRRAGVHLSDRRAVKVQKVIAAAALLAGRDRPTEADLWPLIYVLPTAEEQAAGRDELRELLEPSESEALGAAAEEASAGPAARARRLTEQARGLLETEPPAEAGDHEGWCLRIEGVVREIDATFSPEVLPPDLARERQRIVDRLGEVAWAEAP